MNPRAQQRLFAPSVVPPPGPLVSSYGGGVNSVAALIFMARAGLRPTAITMADPGSEWRATMRYLAEVTRPWLATIGFPPVTVLTRVEEGLVRPRVWRRETLIEECVRTRALPSIAYGKKKCSQKYKGEPQRWWAVRQSWATDEWASGRKLVRVIGYDADESGRVLGAALNGPPAKKGTTLRWDQDRFVGWYPLHEAHLTRDDCEDLIRSEGLPLPPKSACTFCPNSSLEEWEKLRRDEPDRFAEAVAMSRNARIDAPESVGLMRCNPMGRRQLHVWADGGYELGTGREAENPMPCECAL